MNSNPDLPDYISTAYRQFTIEVIESATLLSNEGRFSLRPQDDSLMPGSQFLQGTCPHMHPTELKHDRNRYSRREDGESDSVNFSSTSTMGLVQGLISVFFDDNDKLRSINAGELRITFLLRSPLYYYVRASTWEEPESVVSSYGVQ